MPETTTINVKSVSASAWEKARRYAAQQDEAMGTWLTRAIEGLANLHANPSMESGNPPAIPCYPPDITPDVFGVLMQGWAAMVNATGVMPARAVVRRANDLGDALVRHAQGLPPRRYRSRRALPKPSPVATLSG